MDFEIDVSGEDIMTKDYVVCIANRDNLIRGFKMNFKTLQSLKQNFNKGNYKYKLSKKDKSTFKIRLYSIIIYYIFKSLNLKGEISLNICRDFTGRENDIKENLQFFLKTLLKLKIDERMYFIKLDNNSNAHKYSYLMRHDTKNKMKTYVKISLDQFEKWLK